MIEDVLMYGDAAISYSGDDAVTGMDIDEFHTYRFESLDGVNYHLNAGQSSLACSSCALQPFSDAIRMIRSRKSRYSDDMGASIRRIVGRRRKRDLPAGPSTIYRRAHSVTNSNR